MRSAAFSRLVCALGLAVLVGAAPLVQAQSDRSKLKGTSRPPPPPSSMQGIPGGINAGTPSTSNSAELGLKTLPTTDAEHAGMKQETAAARAARRGRPVSSQAAVPASGAAPLVPTVKEDVAKGKATAKPATSKP